jgi:hypothetical protein
MATCVIVDGQVVYGDETELKNVQMREVRQELERLTADVQRLIAALEAAKSTIEPVLLNVEPVVDDLLDTAVSHRHRRQRP